MSKFTNIEAALLKRLYKEFTLEDLNKIVVKTINSPESYWDVEKKYIILIKLYGLMPEPNRYGGYDTDKLTELTKYAKWVVDNIPDDLPKDELIDFKNIENPIKAEMKTYEVNASESGSQTMYRSGWVEILAWDEDDAEEKATKDFYEWGGEMEDDDYGEWHGDGIELEHLNLKEQRRLARKYGIISHQPVRPGDIINESTSKINPELKVGDIVRVIDVDGEHARMPERFGVYKVVKERNLGHDTYYDIVPYPEPEISDIFSLSDTLKMSPIKTLYLGDTWIYGDTPTANKVDIQKIDQLPQGKLFNDAKNIEGVFKKSSHSWSKVIELFEKNKNKSKLEVIDTKDIHITQPNIQANKVKNMLDKVNNLPPINVIEFEDGEKVIYDAHHRLIANWVLNNNRVEVNLVKINNIQEDESLHKWFKRSGPKGKEGGWVDCNTCKDGYEVDPDEMAALKAESTWEYYMGYIKHDLNEHKKSKFNPELMVGDEVTVINVDKSYGTMNTPKHLKDYVVTGIKYRQPENWEGPEADTKYYVIVPIGGYSDEEATGRMLSGGGRIKEEHLYSTDTWMLRKGFLRGELDERETNIKMLGENWRDTSWEDDDGKITIGDITDYLGNDIRNISVSDLENKLGDKVSSVTQGEERIMKADLQYPIILVQKDGEFSYVLDGNHRLAKAIMTGEEYIKAKVLYLDDKNTPEEFKRLLGREEVTNEHEEGYQSMSKDEVQTIVDKVYPHIINNLGESIYVDELPKVELWEDIYARLSKIPGATGEESESSEAQYEGKENKIFVYYPNMKDVKHVIQSLLHEYTHYLQDPDESEENRKDGYENDPYETAASEAEENWEDYMVYLKDNLNEKFASKAQQRFLYATNKKVAKKLGSKMTKKDYKELPDKVEEDLENWSYDGNSIGVEKELDEYCPMGKPNKCKLVDYNNLPDMVKSETIEEQFGKELTMADAIKRDVMKVLAMRFTLTPTEESNIKDANGQSYTIVDTENPFEEITMEMLIEPIINMFNDGISGGELSPEDTNIAISGVTDWLSLAMHQTVDLPN